MPPVPIVFGPSYVLADRRHLKSLWHAALPPQGSHGESEWRDILAPGRDPVDRPLP